VLTTGFCEFVSRFFTHLHGLFLGLGLCFIGIVIFGIRPLLVRAVHRGRSLKGNR
jgi:hypothetical protein